MAGYRVNLYALALDLHALRRLRQQAPPKRYLTEYYHTQKSVILRVLRTLRSEGNVLEHTTVRAWVSPLPHPSRPVLWASVMIKYKIHGTCSLHGEA
jgi:hypothetical protein